RVQEVMARLEQEKGALPTEDEMADAMDISVREYRELMAEIRPATFVCLDSVRGGDGDESQRHGDTLADEHLISPREQAARRELAEMITERLETLPEVQRKVLALYYFEDLRLREIAEVFGVTESRICQIHAQAILALKSFLRRQDPELAVCQ